MLGQQQSIHCNYARTQASLGLLRKILFCSKLQKVYFRLQGVKDYSGKSLSSKFGSSNACTETNDPSEESSNIQL